MHTEVRREAGAVVTEETVSLTFLRLGEPLALEMASLFRETEAGEPLEARTVQRLGADETVQRLRFDALGVELATREGGRERVQRVPRPEGPWLAPGAARRLVAAEIARGAREIRYRALEPGAGSLVSETAMTLVGREPVEVLGAVVPALAWDIRSSVLPEVVGRDYTDDQGRVVRSTLPLLPGVALTVVQADRELARGRVDPPELLARTLVTPKGSLPEPRRLRRAVYRLSGAPLAGVPSGGPQGVQASQDGSVRVTVDLDAPGAPGAPPGEEARRPSALVDSDSPEVVRLAERALAGAKTRTPTEEAEALRRFVHGFVTRKDLSVGFASAGQVARTAQGDCTEHAVLLAALLRARGVPSRAASGLLFVDHFLGHYGVFGYHMWTQAWLDRGGGARWVDLDATLDAAPDDRSFDAAHITLSTSALGDNDVVNDLLHLVPLLGRLSIEVLEPR
ncbi:MAG: transglutaminase domain-containing protein, partial [Deltaproteobacteria bacterium]|nr:transglutaminase domain-containing protein [Deltaproteobacteria bacterium]